MQRLFALSITTLAVPTSLQCLADLLQDQWPAVITNISERIVNAFAFGEAGSARAKLAAAALTGEDACLHLQNLAPFESLCRSRPLACSAAIDECHRGPPEAKVRLQNARNAQIGVP